MRPSIPQHILNFFKQEGIDPDKNSFLLAISGGLDSVALLHACLEAGIRPGLAHCNFCLRGEESEADEAFVKELVKHLGLRLHVERFETTKEAADRKLSIQETARQLRYEWFNLLCEEEDYNYIITAHHADDTIETLLLNFFRGTGIKGMSSIPVKNGRVLRPLLQTRRREIHQYAVEKGCKWMEDSSNSENKYKRNFLRNELLPLLRQQYPGLDNSLIKTVRRFSKIEEFYEAALEKTKQNLVSRKGDGSVHLPVAKLLAAHSELLLFEIIREFGFNESQLDDVMGLLQASSGKFIQNETHQIIRHRRWLIIAPKTRESSIHFVETTGEATLFGGGTLFIEEMPSIKEAFSSNRWEAKLDAKEIQFPLILRKWKQGDYFYPLGMPKKKKVARFLIDAKVSKDEKEKTWVLESSGRILWVVGHRIDHRFRIQPSTKKMLSITVQDMR